MIPEPKYLALRWETGTCWIEVRKHTDGRLTCHYKACDGQTYNNQVSIDTEALHSIAVSCLGLGHPEVIGFVSEMRQAAKRLEEPSDPRYRGIYIGLEKQFEGRSAHLVVYSTLVMAQFNTGKLWETHSRLNFPIEDWEIEPHSYSGV